MGDYNVEFIEVDSLIPYGKNAKTHPDEQIERIAKSIEDFGFRQNLVIDKDNTVIIGHGRLLAAKKLGLSVVPCVRVEDLSKDQINALRLADNKVAESEWDIDLLAQSLDEIPDIDMSDFGFDLDIDDIVEDSDIVEDEAKDDVEERCKLGDIWLLGRWVYCKKCGKKHYISCKS